MPRTRPLATVWLLAVLASLFMACSPQTPASAPGSAASPPDPSDPGVVVALDDFAAINVLALGVTPDIAFDTFGYTTSAALLAEAGITAKPYGQSLDIEAVAAADPDVIVGTSLPTTVEQKTRLERLGTTVILEYTADWQTALRETAAALGLEDRAERISRLVQDRSADLKRDLAAAGEAGQPISIIAGSADGAFSPPAKTNLGALITSLGLERPAPQKAAVAADAPFVNIAEENLTANDGSALFLMKGKTYPVQGITSSPLYPKLEAVRTKRAFQVSGEMWFGSNPVSALWVVDDVRRTLLEGESPLTEAEAGSRLRALTSATAS